MEKNNNIFLSDIQGIEEYKEEITDIIKYFKEREKFEEIGAKIPKGILMTGKPGVGKTMIAKAIANEANISFINVNGSDFEETYVNLGATRIKKLFEDAKK